MCRHNDWRGKAALLREITSVGMHDRTLKALFFKVLHCRSQSCACYCVCANHFSCKPESTLSCSPSHWHFVVSPVCMQSAMFSTVISDLWESVQFNCILRTTVPFQTPEQISAIRIQHTERYFTLALLPLYLSLPFLHWMLIISPVDLTLLSPPCDVV